MVGILAAIQLEKDHEKKKAKEKKEDDQKEKERKKIEKEINRAHNKINAMPGIVFDVQQGLAYVLKKKVPEMRELLDYYYNVNLQSLNKMNKPELITLITAKMTTTTTTTTHNDNDNDNDNNNNLP